MNSGDTAFMIICAALVFFMTPGLAFFYEKLEYFIEDVRKVPVLHAVLRIACISYDVVEMAHYVEISEPFHFGI